MPAGASVRPKRLLARGAMVPLLLFLPLPLFLFVAFVVLPVVDAAQFSLFDWSGYGPLTDFVGLKNYEDVLTHRNFGTSVRNSLIVVGVSLGIQLPLAMWCALALAERSQATAAIRMLFFLPYMLAEVAAALIWRFLYDGNDGLLPAIGDLVGVNMPFVLGDRFWVIPAIMLVTVWKYFGFYMMIYIAALQAIPRDVVEAARLDGARKWQIVWFVKLPMVWSAVAITIFFSVTGALQFFDMIIPLSNGGPSNTSHSIVSFLYQFGIVRMKIGFGSALSVMLFVACVLVALLYRWGTARMEKD